MGDVPPMFSVLDDAFEQAAEPSKERGLQASYNDGVAQPAER